MFPTRSGTEVVYLEQAYPKPRFLVPIMYAFSTVLLSFVLGSLLSQTTAYNLILCSSNAANAVVFAQYFLIIWDIEVTPYRQTVIAVLVTAVALTGAHLLCVWNTMCWTDNLLVIAVAISTKWSLRIINTLSSLKVLSALLLVNYILCVT